MNNIENEGCLLWKGGFIKENVSKIYSLPVKVMQLYPL